MSIGLFKASNSIKVGFVRFVPVTVAVNVVQPRLDFAMVPLIVGVGLWFLLHKNYRHCL